MENILNQLPQKAKEAEAENKKFFAKLKKKPPKHLDSLMQDLHEAEFQKTDCLTCANCCKTTGPLFTDKDVERISKHFRMKPQQFIETYLRVDEDKAKSWSEAVVIKRWKNLYQIPEVVKQYQKNPDAQGIAEVAQDLVEE